MNVARQTCSIVIPVFNEQAGVTQFHTQLGEAIALLSYRFEILYVNDGSTDETLTCLGHVKLSADFIGKGWYPFR